MSRSWLLNLYPMMGTHFPRDRVDTRTGKEKDPWNLEYLVMTENNKVLFKNGFYQKKRHRRQHERSPNDQSWKNFSNAIIEC